MKPTGGEVLGADSPVFDDPLIDDHSCTCAWRVEALTIPNGERHHDQHASMRFGDNQWHPRVLVDGVSVEDRCYEAIGGEQGRAWCFRPNDWGRIWHQCKTCGQGACVEVKTGRVEIRWDSGG